MTGNKLTVTIGIPAYNESGNIQALLRSLLTQKHSTYTLKRIIVVNDASTDLTDKKVRRIRSKKITLLTNPKRSGQVYCQNMIFGLAETDLVILMEGDTIPINNHYIQNLIIPLRKDPEAGYVQGNIRTVSSDSLLGKILSVQKNIYHQFTSRDSRINPWFSSGRGGRAFARSVYTKLRWPPAVPEDDFALLWNRKHHVRTYFQRSACCWYKVPQTMGDYITQIQKNDAARVALQPYFSPDLISKIFDRPPGHRAAMAVYFFRMTPLYFCAFGLIQTAAYIQRHVQVFSDIWVNANSTKQLPIYYEHTTH